MFKDRHDAGRQLAQALLQYSYSLDTVIIALPRGGVVVGSEVSKCLHIPLDIVCPRKIGAPENKEFAIGAITESGEGIFSSGYATSDAYLKKTIEEEIAVAKKRMESYRKNLPPRNLKNKMVILTDDGVATGLTMQAAIKTVRSEMAKEIILAIPVAPPDTLARLRNEVDRVICLMTPLSFYAVGQFYEHFDQTTDEEVIELLATAASSQK